MVTRLVSFGSLVVLGLSTLAACKTAGAKDDKKEGSAAAPAMADDALIGSCQAKDDSFCDEYRNKKGLKDEARSVELTLTKGACESDLKNGVWREGKACEAKTSVGRCIVDKPDSLKRIGHTLKGDEEMTAAACKDLMGGKWESGLADDALLGSCTVGTGCTEIHNKASLEADSRSRGVNSEKESCERLEGEFSKDKACDASKARAKCTTKGEYRLTTIRYETGADKQSIADAKELCGISEGTFETLTPAKK